MSSLRTAPAGSNRGNRASAGWRGELPLTSLSAPRRFPRCSHGGSVSRSRNSEAREYPRASRPASAPARSSPAPPPCHRGTSKHLNSNSSSAALRRVSQGSISPALPRACIFGVSAQSTFSPIAGLMGAVALTEALPQICRAGFVYRASPRRPPTPADDRAQPTQAAPTIEVESSPVCWSRAAYE